MISIGFVAILVLAVVLLVLYLDNQGEPRWGEGCTHDDNCTPQVWEYFCDGNYACNYTVHYRCLSPGTEESKCVPRNCSVACFDCEGGCEDGFCAYKPDLVIIRYTNTTSPDGEISLFPIVKNIGISEAGSTKLRSVLNDDIIQVVNVPRLLPDEEATLSPIEFIASRGNIYRLDWLVDYQDFVDEINENNNNYSVSVFY